VIWIAIVILYGLIGCVVLDVNRQCNNHEKALFDLECRLEQRIVKLERALDRGE
jgi:hypothetical protein